MAEVLLSYRRVGEGYTGALCGVEFHDVSYASMMMATSLRLQEDPDAHLILQRTDRPNLMPASLSPAQLLLLREDPLRYIKQTSASDVVIDLRGSKQGHPARIPRSGGLRTGHDTLAAAVGSRVYLRLRGTDSACRVEHVGTGRWVALSDFLREFSALSSHHHAWDLHFITDTSGWLSVSTELLLGFDLDRFYLPREWNPNGNWITKAELQALYERFKKEKDECHSEMKTAR